MNYEQWKNCKRDFMWPWGSLPVLQNLGQQVAARITAVDLSCVHRSDAETETGMTGMV